jgi:hypothetical protein
MKSREGRFVATGLAALAAGLAAVGAPAWATTCTPVNGHSATTLYFSGETMDNGQTCTAGGGICTRGVVTGGLRGDLELESFEAEPNPQDPTPLEPRIRSVVRFIGESRIAMHDGGTLVGVDVGAIDTQPATAGRVGTLLTWVAGGTGRYEQASGHIVIHGVVDFTTRTVATDYRGDLCVE